MKILKPLWTIGLSILLGCNMNGHQRIIVGDMLLANKSTAQKRELTKAIEKALNKDASGIIRLVNYNCGGGEACYELGFVLTQIIYKVGEDEFTAMVQQTDKKQLKGIYAFISAGLEYGDNDRDGKMDKKQIENEFPKLNKLLN